MTDPTNLRARAEALLKSAPSFAKYHRERAGYRGASQEFHDLALGFITATGDALRDLLAALNEAVDNRTALEPSVKAEMRAAMAKLAALPPEAPGERRPVAGWRACASRGEDLAAARADAANARAVATEAIGEMSACASMLTLHARTHADPGELLAATADLFERSAATLRARLASPEPGADGAKET